MGSTANLTPPIVQGTLPGPMLREAIEAAREKRGWSILKLSQEADVPYSGLYGLLHPKPGKRAGGLTADNLEKVMVTLGLRVTDRPPAKRKPTR